MLTVSWDRKTKQIIVAFDAMGQLVTISGIMVTPVGCVRRVITSAEVGYSPGTPPTLNWQSDASFQIPPDPAFGIPMPMDLSKHYLIQPSFMDGGVQFYDPTHVTAFPKVTIGPNMFRWQFDCIANDGSMTSIVVTGQDLGGGGHGAPKPH